MSEDGDEEEQRAADALARALDRGGASDDLPEDALQTAALIRYSSDGGALSQEREDALYVDVLAAAEKAAAQRDRRVERAPSPWWRWIAAFAGVSAVAIVLVIVFGGPFGRIAPTALPTPDASLLSASMARQQGGDDASFEDEMGEYRGSVYAALGERYGSR